ncbi:helix-turn-helix transcriptional regulator [Ferruginibacter sp. HRS2-29]|uniref:helix-turn-helix domain-containing protein n=1 Tax=Ferruginibacter sp. HRS2-29 TaxID=2487334 RepID=UPI0020CEA172|nr:helix-turn-helix transcriptional regulator [Ferruginibacter sp. HRS2-29]MCP9750312.1 XRE family transcriptional regulator [Ferruginibacter sp. HRS2-29]
MLTIMELREKYGISLSEMAEYLGVSKSTAAKAERMERPLTILPEAKLLEFKTAAYIQMEAPDEMRQKNAAKTYIDAITELQLRLNQLPGRIQLMKKKLLKAQNAYPAKLRFLELTDHLAQFSKGNSRDNIKDQVWLHKMSESAAQKLKECDLAAQLEIRRQIGLMEAEKTVIENLIQETNEQLLAITPAAEVVGILEEQSLLNKSFLLGKEKQQAKIDSFKTDNSTE